MLKTLTSVLSQTARKKNLTADKKPMKIKIPILTLCACLLALCIPASAQQTGKVFRIGFLDSSTASGSVVLVDAFRQEMGKLGWIEGKNIANEYRFAEGKTDRLPELAADLTRLKVDLIVGTDTEGADTQIGPYTRPTI
jgi:hypothetical protein